jgi:hypothetical protein
MHDTTLHRFWIYELMQIVSDNPPVVSINVAIGGPDGSFLTGCGGPALVATDPYAIERVDCIVSANGAGARGSVTLSTPAVSGLVFSGYALANLNFQPPVITALQSNNGPVNGGQVRSSSCCCVHYFLLSWCLALRESQRAFHSSLVSLQVLVVSGRGFGPNPQSIDDITIGSTSCASTAYISSTSVSCVTPSGVGYNLPVTVSIIGQSSTGGPLYSYRAPSISSINPNHIFVGTDDTIFAVNFQGSDFGTGANTIYSLAIGAVECGSIQWSSSTSVYCNSLSLFDVLGGAFIGSGNTTTLGVSIAVAGPLASSALLSGFTVLGPPTVTSVSPSTVSPGTLLTIRGGPFGYSLEDLTSIKIGGVECTSIAVLDISTASCTIPGGTGFGLAVVVKTAGGQSSTVTSASRVSYFVGQAAMSGMEPRNGPTLGTLSHLIHMKCSSTSHASGVSQGAIT